MPKAEKLLAAGKKTTGFLSMLKPKNADTKAAAKPSSFIGDRI